MERSIMENTEIDFIIFTKTKNNLKDLIPSNGKAVFIGPSISDDDKPDELPKSFLYDEFHCDFVNQQGTITLKSADSKIRITKTAIFDSFFQETSLPGLEGFRFAGHVHELKIAPSGAFFVSNI